MPDIFHNEMEAFEANKKTVEDESQLQLKKQLKEETKSLKEELSKVRMENQALQGQLTEVLQILRSNLL